MRRWRIASGLEGPALRSLASEAKLAAMKSRITMSLSKDGELEIWLNEAGRDLLVTELQSLDRKDDHFHLTTAGPFDVELSDIPYREDDKCLSQGKVLFRPDDWDQEFYPHVMQQPDRS